MKLWQPWGRVYEACGVRMTLKYFQIFCQKEFDFLKGLRPKKKKKKRENKKYYWKESKENGWLAVKKIPLKYQN